MSEKPDVCQRCDEMEKVIHLKVALAATKAMYDVVCDAEEKTVLLEKLNACHAQLADTQAALAEAVDVLKLLISSAVVFADDRVDYVKMQIYKDDLEGARQFTQSPAAKAALQAYKEVGKP